MYGENGLSTQQPHCGVAAPSPTPCPVPDSPQQQLTSLTLNRVAMLARRMEERDIGAVVGLGQADYDVSWRSTTAQRSSHTSAPT